MTNWRRFACLAGLAGVVLAWLVLSAVLASAAAVALTFGDIDEPTGPEWGVAGVFLVLLVTLTGICVGVLRELIGRFRSAV